ncbi:MAG: hypothetical protein KIY12_09735 [Thermoplasmata archaeon]|uniref:Uncharacterized protein n=1 Tax=Candidatus Sysuiplasma superficiale TaxID=2823368 RepID=A0A8J8CE19_9ARCH|nr:hypothetical protein [Candidatus Sysuiplasma superficiale]MBX8644980.1 hypothetical protein [Candidatus Sysuiplasma superficiale]MCL4347439.1 hypothetical protein [Candidatus Thermoplasmatota archaeon]
MTPNPDGLIAGRSLENGSLTWSHKYDMNVRFEPPGEDDVCAGCGGPLIARDGRWHPVLVKNGKYYCEKCSKQTQ